MWFSIFLVIAISTKNNPRNTLVSWLLLLRCSWPLFYLKCPIPHLCLRHWTFYFILLVNTTVFWFFLTGTSWIFSVGLFSSTDLYMWGGPVFRCLFFFSYALSLYALIQYHDVNAFSSLRTLKFMLPAQTYIYLPSQYHLLGICYRHLKLITPKNELFIFSIPIHTVPISINGNFIF